VRETAWRKKRGARKSADTGRKKKKEPLPSEKRGKIPGKKGGDKRPFAPRRKERRSWSFQTKGKKREKKDNWLERGKKKKKKEGRATASLLLIGKVGIWGEGRNCPPNDSILHMKKRKKRGSVSFSPSRNIKKEVKKRRLKEK